MDDQELLAAYATNRSEPAFAELVRSFTIPEVLPGKYFLFVNVAQGYLGSGPDSNPSGPGDHRVASTGMRVFVPEGDTTAPLDLGDVVLVAD